MKNGGENGKARNPQGLSVGTIYINSAAPLDLKEKVRKKIKTAIITGENRMSSIKEYFKEEGRKEGIEQGLNSEELYRENQQ